MDKKVTDQYADKMEREKEWYVQSKFQSKHFLNSKLFYSPKRNEYNYVFPKTRMSLLIKDILKAKETDKPSILVAPLGTGDDLRYIKNNSATISGIDISKEAIDKINDDTLKKFQGDLKNMHMFPDGQFDIVLASLFFHHFVKYGFNEFLNEMYRVLKPGGHLISLEPSSLHPVHMITWLGKKFFGNITGTIRFF